MSVSINNVYKSVLVITNKDNRGYITPEEFNQLALQAQNEIFESYFVKSATYEASPILQSDFSDPLLSSSEKKSDLKPNSIHPCFLITNNDSPSILRVQGKGKMFVIGSAAK